MHPSSDTTHPKLHYAFTLTRCFNLLCAQNLGVPAGIMPSMSDSSIASAHDTPDGQIRRSHSEEKIARNVMEFSDDEEMEYYENLAPKAKPAKHAKPKGRPPTRKSARNNVKTEFSDGSD